MTWKYSIEKPEHSVWLQTWLIRTNGLENVEEHFPYLEKYSHSVIGKFFNFRKSSVAKELNRIKGQCKVQEDFISRIIKRLNYYSYEVETRRNMSISQYFFETVQRISLEDLNMYCKNHYSYLRFTEEKIKNNLSSWRDNLHPATRLSFDRRIASNRNLEGWPIKKNFRGYLTPQVYEASLKMLYSGNKMVKGKVEKHERLLQKAYEEYYENLQTKFRKKSSQPA